MLSLSKGVKWCKATLCNKYYVVRVTIAHLENKTHDNIGLEAALEIYFWRAPIITPSCNSVNMTSLERLRGRTFK